MPSNYKRLGDYIEPVGPYNEGMEVEELLGISNQKYFQKAKTNTIGINLEKYRIVRTGEFAFNRATTRNGDKISIALRQGSDCIVSPSYRIFRSKDENVLNSEYLMMWFRRPEFDRYARFKSHGSAHEFFDMDEMNEVQLPVPHIDVQRAMVKEYNTITNRIKLNEQLNQKLEETAQTLYRHWFVDFEFPYDFQKGEPSLQGQPYKSSGGEMLWCEELEKEIPKGWDNGVLSELCKIEMGQSPKGDTYNSDGEGTPLVNGPVEFGRYFTNETKWTTSPTKLCQANDLIVCVRGSTTGRFVKSNGVYCLGRGVCSIRAHQSQHFVDNLFNNLLQELLTLTTGSTFPNWSRDVLEEQKIVKPSSSVIQIFDRVIEPLVAHVQTGFKEIEVCEDLRTTVLSKMSTVETGVAGGVGVG